MKAIPFCPICGSQEFIEFNNRPNARCKVCHSMERTRLMYHVLCRDGMLKPDVSIFHAAPEPGLALRLRNMTKNYLPGDLDAERYQKWLPETRKVDLCKVDECLPETFDLILHNHVMEHLPCKVEDVLVSLKNHLKPGGRMYFSVPIRANAKTEEDLNPNLSNEERLERFGQWDHMRIFGELDVLPIFQSALGEGFEVIELDKILSKREAFMNALDYTIGKITGHTLFRYTNPIY